ncbi:MAG: class I SAM-dependent methyltransferase, partial [Anaerolineales bacterium]|nr:class I SAM-dependent methyltransferase [Anaerolineales bacterium]
MVTPNFFTSGSPYLNHPLLTAERTSKEVDFVIAQTALEQGSSILDVGCGFGRHSIELARRGYDVVGIDPSEAMISAANQRAAEVWENPKFMQARGEEFSSEDKFDAAICLFTTLGQIDEIGENTGLVKRVAEALSPEGMFIIEVPNLHWLAENIKTSERFGDDENYTEITRELNQETNIVTENFEVVSPEKNKEYLLRYRLLTQKELGKLLSEARFATKAIYGDYDGHPYTYYT